MAAITLKKSAKYVIGKMGLLDYAKKAADTLKIAGGFVSYGFTGRTPGFAYQSMIRLFCSTKGVSSDIMARVVSLFSIPYKIDHPSGVLGRFSSGEIQSIADEISEKGYYVFEKRLSPEKIQNLLSLSMKYPAKIVSDSVSTKNTVPALQVYDPLKPLAVKYDCQLTDMIEDETVQELIADESLFAVSQAYLKSKPILDIISMWWSTTQKEPDAKAAQFFHFDMDRIKWLKFFFYVTDVEKENGPHKFVEGSHRSRCIPQELLKQGYARLSDAEVEKHFDASKLIEFTGPVGTIIAEDTRGLHKGQVLLKGHRLVFQLEFTNCLFGGNLQAFPKPRKMTDSLKKAWARYPEIYKIFLSKQ